MSVPPESFDESPTVSVVRLFPLPEVVLYPHLGMPLHIFEDRYKAMVGDALDGDRLVAMATLEPGWDGDETEPPAIHNVVCIGRITAEERLPDGRYTLILHGVTRARILKELDLGTLYRTARVETLVESHLSHPARSRDSLRHELFEQFRVHVQADDVEKLLTQLVSAQLGLGVLCDVLAGASRLSSEEKYDLLAEANVDRRARRLLASLRENNRRRGLAEEPRFPPAFSAN